MTTDRHASTTGAWRLVRGTAVGTCASGIGALAHVGAGGGPPPLHLLILLAAGVTAGCAVASRWRWSLPSLVVVMLLAQLAFHQVFTEYAGSAAHAMHAMHAAQAAPGQAAPEPAAPMAVSHTVAALGLALLLRFGESWLRRVIDAFGLLLRRVIGPWWSPSPRRPQIAVPAADTLAVCGDHPATDVWSRGPPQ